MSSRSAAASHRAWRVLIVDDHPVVRCGLREILDEQDEFEVCSEADTARGAIAEIDSCHPDVAIIDISLRKGNGLDLVKQIRERDRTIGLLVWSMHDEELFAERALRAGANGYINKEAAVDDLVCAVREVVEGRIYLSPSIAQRLLQTVGHQRSRTQATGIDALSDREVTVFEMIGGGLTTRQIADHLGLSVKTIDSHRENIKDKLGLESANELVRHAVLFVLRRS